MSDFQLVKSRKNRKKRTDVNLNKDRKQNEANIEVDVDNIGLKLNEAILVLKISEFYSDVRDLVRNTQIEEIVCYGIGNFADCCIARYQLALLTLLREDVIQIDKSYCYFYDPKLYKEEKEFLRSSGFTVIAENEEGKRRSRKKTLFYMPHCGKSLYNNLLWSNWNSHNLSQCVVIGNSFSNIVDMNPRRKLVESCWYVLTIVPYTTEERLPENFQYTDIFNDTVIISFPEDKLQEVTSQTWQHIDEPVYCEDDKEFISNKS